MTAYYNEHDPYAAEWLRRLILNGHIAPGDVDESDIRDIRPDDLKGYTQWHFFAGIGVWSHALRRAGWADDRPIWTGSCPCQPFSAAGARAGFDDERHLWPAFNHLIDQCRPPIVVGEQVENAGDWLDLVSTDLEAQGYAFGAAFLPAAGFGGAHIRSRCYWLADDTDERHERAGGARGRRDGPAHRGDLGGLADLPSARRDGAEQNAEGDSRDETRVRVPSAERGTGRLVDGEQPRLEGHAGDGDRSEEPGRIGSIATGSVAKAGGVSGMGHNQRTCAPMLGRNPVDWLFCRDGKWRPVEPGTFPLADAAPARVGRLRAYGNALDAETATQFLEAVMASL